MKLSQRILIALVSASLFAAVCTLLLHRTMVHASAAATARMRYYTTPTRAIHPGDLLEQGDVKVLAWPANDAVHGALEKREDVLHRVALDNIAPGQPILESHLAPPGSGSGLASRIPNGMRAIALKSDEVIGVAGFLNPGSHVDVLVTTHGSFGADAVTSTVLQNVEVVATNQQTEPNPNGKPTTATVVTLLLTPPEAQRALLASNQGSVQLVLRNSSDGTTSDAAPIALSQIAPSPHTPQNPLAGGAPQANSGVLPAAGRSLPAQHSALGGPAPAAKHAAVTSSGVEMVYGGRTGGAAQNDMALAGGKL